MSAKANRAFVKFFKINRNLTPKAFCLSSVILFKAVREQVVIPLIIKLYFYLSVIK